MSKSDTNAVNDDGSDDDQSTLWGYGDAVTKRAHDEDTCTHDVEQCVGIDALDVDADGSPQLPSDGSGILCFGCYSDASGDGQ